MFIFILQVFHLNRIWNLYCIFYIIFCLLTFFVFFFIYIFKLNMKHILWYCRVHFVLFECFHLATKTSTKELSQLMCLLLILVEKFSLTNDILRVRNFLFLFFTLHFTLSNTTQWCSSNWDFIFRVKSKKTFCHYKKYWD